MKYKTINNFITSSSPLSRNDTGLSARKHKSAQRINGGMAVEHTTEISERQIVRIRGLFSYTELSANSTQLNL